MSKPRVVRSLLAIATVATLLSTPYRSPGTELHGLVVTGITLDRVASRHSIPDYPQDARSLRIQGQVQVRIEVQHGKMVNVTAESTRTIPANYSSHWVRWYWQFRPTVSGVYCLPISYKLTV